MPGAKVSSFVGSLAIGIAGETIEFDTSEGDILSYRVYLSYGAWGSASLTLKKRASGADPRAFSSPITISADDGNDAVDLEGADSVVLRVDTASSTAGAVARVTMTLKGDRLPSSFAKFGVDSQGVFVAGNPSGFDSPDGGGGL